MWSLLALAAAIFVGFPVGCVVVGRVGGHRARAVGLGTGPSVTTLHVRGVEVQLGALPLGSWVRFDEEPAPWWIGVTVHGTLAAVAGVAALATGPDLVVGLLRFAAGVLWLAEPSPTSWRVWWALDAARPIATASTAVGVLGALNVALVGVQDLARRLPPVGCGLLVVWSILGVRAMWLAWG